MSFDFTKLSVLVAEDVTPLRELIVALLKGFGIHDITATSNGEEAFDIFQKQNNDIIITDWAMEPLDGIELTHRVRNSAQSPNRTVPIIVVTGYNAWSRVEEARDTGATEFLIKPFKAIDIGRRLSHVITHPRDFIESSDFFGPDRRRKQDPSYEGDFRREADKKDYSSTGN